MRIEKCKSDCLKISVVLFFLFLFWGCGPKDTAQTPTAIKSNDVLILEENDIKVVAKHCSVNAESGTANTEGIYILAGGKTKLGAISGAVFYDHDANGELNELDGVIFEIDSGVGELSSQAVFQPGIVSRGSGIGNLMLECNVAVFVDGREIDPKVIKADLSPIFTETDKKH